jgi:outer membrane protein OmpA-like peptidoglycan-associated protein
MTWPKRVGCAFAIGILSAGSAAAQITERPLEVSGTAGLFDYDTRALTKMGPAFGGALGWRAQSWLTLEGHALFGPSKSDTVPQVDVNLSAFGLDLRWNLRPADGRMVPFLLTGLAYAKSHAGGHPPEELERGAPSIGGGVLVNVINQRTYARLQVRDLLFKDRDRAGFSNHFAVTAGLQYVFGGKPRDTDIDGVRDWIDECPLTPLGARVDPRGCPLDADADSVFDGIDACDDTPRGCRVDAKGCPIDTDGDGVCDGLDECADTPAGKPVDAKGCLADPDEDGVRTPQDQCEGTPAGCVVDERGCPKDSDGDGVCDGRDQCPDLGAGYTVNAEGCPEEVLERERQMLDTGRIRIRQISFASGSTAIDSAAGHALDIVAAVIARWPQLKIEVAGHADGRERRGRELSQARADTVRSLLLQRQPRLPADSLSAVGYGSDRPAASNDTVEGRDRNRRVEFVVLNRAVLLEELRRRRLMEQMNEENK